MNSRCGADKGVTSAEECYNKLVTQYDACSTTFVWSGSACLCITKSATSYETHQDSGTTSYRYDGKTTSSPTATPTLTPTSNPSQNPTATPTQTPTSNPSQNPTATPTLTPTRNPSTSPSIQFSDLTAVTDTSFGVVSGGGQCWYDGNHGAVCDGSEDQVWLCL